MPAFVAYRRGNYERARALLEEALTLLRPLGDKWCLNTVLFNLAMVLLAQGEIDQAIAACVEGMSHAHKLGDNRSLTWCLAGLSMAEAEKRAGRRSARLWGAAEGLSESIASPLPRFMRHFADVHLPQARQSLGDQGFATALTEGRQMTTDAAVAYALDEEA